jgi:hypothetical protein
MNNAKYFVCFMFIIIGCMSYSFIPNNYKPISLNENENIYKTYDEFNKITFYQHKELFPNIEKYSMLEDKHSRTDRTGFSPIAIYIGQKQNIKSIHIVLTHTGDSWIFFTNAILVNDKSDTIEWNFNPFKMNREIWGHGIKESIDFVENIDTKSKFYIFLTKSKNVKIKFSGDNHSVIYHLSNEQTVALIDLINYSKTL